MNDCLLVGLLILDSAIQFLILNEIVITSALNLMTLKESMSLMWMLLTDQLFVFAEHVLTDYC